MFSWKKGVISNKGAWTLQDPNGANVAHAVPVLAADRPTGRVWWAITDRGDVIATFDTCRQAMVAVDNECRPCDASTETGSPCCHDRAPGSRYCLSHQSEEGS
jgi:hypothetical protein